MGNWVMVSGGTKSVNNGTKSVGGDTKGVDVGTKSVGGDTKGVDVGTKSVDGDSKDVDDGTFSADADSQRVGVTPFKFTVGTLDTATYKSTCNGPPSTTSLTPITDYRLPITLTFPRTFLLHRSPLRCIFLYKSRR